MATITVNTNTNYSGLTIADGDSISMSNGARLTVNETTDILEDITINGLHSVSIDNTSTTTPIFLRMGNSTGSKIDASGGGVIRSRGEWIELGVSTGLSGQTFTLPTDIDGNQYGNLGGLQVVDGSDVHLYAQTTTLSDKLSDPIIGRFFTQASNVVTFGDGVNGFIPPSGAVIRIPNIQIQCGLGLEIETSSLGNIDFSICSISTNCRWDIGFGCGYTIMSDCSNHDPSFGISNNGTPLGVFNLNNFTMASSSGTILINSLGDNSTWDNVLLYSNPSSASSTTRSTIRGNNSTFSNIIAISENFSGSSFRGSLGIVAANSTFNNIYAIGGSGGASSIYFTAGADTLSLNNINVSSKALTTDSTSTGSGLLSNGGKNLTFDGVYNYPDSSEYGSHNNFMSFANGRSVNIKNVVTNGFFQCAVVVKISVYDTTLENFNIQGQVSGEVMDISTVYNTIKAINVKLLDAQSGNPDFEMVSNSKIDMVSSFGNPLLQDKTQNVVFYDDNSFDSGNIYMLPFYDSNNSATSIISGDASDFLVNSARSYITENGSELETESRVIRGVTDLTGFTLSGTAITDFTLNFAIRVRNGTYTAFQELTSANLISAFSGLVGYTSTSGFQIKVRVSRTTGSGITSYLTRLQIPCTIDSGFSASFTVNNPINAENLIDGTRVRVFNLTQSTEIDNSVVSGGLGYSKIFEIGLNADAVVGDTIELYATYANGLLYKEPLKLTGVMTSTGLTFVDNQVDWNVANNLSLDGSIITEFTADYPNVEVDIDDTDNQTTKQRLIAWYCHEITTEDGIRNLYDGINLQDISNYEVITSIVDLKLDNKKSSPLLFTDSARLFRDDGNTVIASSSNSIQLDAGKVFETSTSGLTPSESAKLSSLDTSNLDETISSRMAGSDYIAPDNAGIANTLTSVDSVKKNTNLIPATI